MAHKDADEHNDVHSSLVRKREEEEIEAKARQYAIDNRVLYSEALRRVRMASIPDRVWNAMSV